MYNPARTLDRGAISLACPLEPVPTVVNYLHSRLHRPETGWDPVSPSHASDYAAGEWAYWDTDLPVYLDAIERQVGSFVGMDILDLGAGPGQYSVAFALRGANVTWHDISHQYLAIGQQKGREFGVADRIRFKVGYMEDAADLPVASFDLVFNRICWFYCRNDAAFAKLVYRLVKPGGHAWIDCPHFARPSTKARLIYSINEHLGIKLGHPCPPPGRLEHDFGRLEGSTVTVTTAADGDEHVLVHKAPSAH